ncbi:MAG: hypothetical protein FWD23_02810 [Oscillospiraceae bacterium]|nr:hypothetical protein [Oscillospiraceae bacterium]
MFGTNDTKRLRELAKKCAETAQLPETKEKIAAWTAHNRGEGYRPMVVAHLANWSGLGLPLQCEDPAAQYFEGKLQGYIAAHELIGDDTVAPPHIQVPIVVNVLPFGTPRQAKYADVGPGYRVIPVIKDITRDLDALPKTTCSYDEKATKRRIDQIGEAVGDILPVRIINDTNMYRFTPTYWIVDYMSMEKMYLAMIEEPEAFSRLMQIVERDMIGCLRWQEQNGLLFLNNGNDHIGSGGYGFSDELPKREIKDGRVLSADIWGHVNSQESVGISPAMYREFVAPCCRRLAEQFGLLYYGCCEPVTTFWDSIQTYPNLRKLSISPWCDEAPVGEFLSGTKIIYSRKPLPDFLTGQTEFLADDYREYIKKTARLTRNCKTEYIMLDTCLINGDTRKIRQAVDIIRRWGAYD